MGRRHRSRPSWQGSPGQSVPAIRPHGSIGASVPGWPRAGPLEFPTRQRYAKTIGPAAGSKASTATSFISLVKNMAFSVPFERADTFAVTSAASPAASPSAARAVESTSAGDSSAEAVSTESPAPRRHTAGRHQAPGGSIVRVIVPGSCLYEAAADGPHRAPELTRGLLVGHGPEVAQHHGRPVSLRQPADLGIEVSEQLGSIRTGIRVRSRHRSRPPGPRGPIVRSLVILARRLRPSGSLRRATGPASHRPGPWRPCAPGRGTWPGRHRRRHAGRSGCGGRRPTPSGRAAGPGPRMPPRPRHRAGSRTAPAIARRSARRPPRRRTASGRRGPPQTDRFRSCRLAPVPRSSLTPCTGRGKLSKFFLRIAREFTRRVSEPSWTRDRRGHDRDVLEEVDRVASSTWIILNCGVSAPLRAGSGPRSRVGRPARATVASCAGSSGGNRTGTPRRRSRRSAAVDHLGQVGRPGHARFNGMLIQKNLQVRIPGSEVFVERFLDPGDPLMGVADEDVRLLPRRPTVRGSLARRSPVRRGAGRCRSDLRWSPWGLPPGPRRRFGRRNRARSVRSRRPRGPCRRGASRRSYRRAPGRRTRGRRCYSP